MIIQTFWLSLIVRNNGMVALEPLGPARLSCIYIYGVCTLLNFIICTHLYYVHITATPLRLHPFIPIFRCRLSSYPNTNKTRSNAFCQQALFTNTCVLESWLYLALDWTPALLTEIQTWTFSRHLNTQISSSLTAVTTLVLYGSIPNVIPINPGRLSFLINFRCISKSQMR
jgi:hypothetical protein